MKDEIRRFVKAPPSFETKRLYFRPIREHDADDMYEYARRKEVSQYLLWSPHADRAYTRRYIGYLLDAYKKGQYYDWAVILKENGRMIGTGGFAALDEKNNMVEIGYVLSSDYWHKGYGTEIASEMICFAFSFFNAQRVQARYIVGNERSRAVMEKCGMTFEGILRRSLLVKGDYRDVGVCSILRDEYLSAHAAKYYDQPKKYKLFS